MAYEIGLTQESMTELENLTEPITHYYRPGSTYIVETTKLGNGHSRAIGYPVITWIFPKLTVLQRDQLKTFCPNGYTNEVYIRSATNDNQDEEKVFKVIMEFPLEEERKAGFRFNFTIKFLVLQELDDLS